MSGALRSGPRCSIAPRFKGISRVSALKLVPRPGTLAKMPWGPRTIWPLVTSYLDPCQGHTKQPSSSMLPPARSARRWRHLRPTAKYSPLLPTAHSPTPVTCRRLLLAGQIPGEAAKDVTDLGRPRTGAYPPFVQALGVAAELKA